MKTERVRPGLIRLTGDDGAEIGRVTFDRLDTGVPNVLLEIDPAHRHRGYSRILAAEALKWAKENGYGGLLARVDAYNPSGMAVCARHDSLICSALTSCAWICHNQRWQRWRPDP
jgi:GNAT superfamily N-acetyltransferase